MSVVMPSLNQVQFLEAAVRSVLEQDYPHVELIVADGLLTGEVGYPILGQQAKLDALRRISARLGISTADALAVGDGANDLDMIRAAGLGIAYKAKPIVAAETRARIEHTDLRTALFFQGYGVSEIVA